MMIQTQQHIDAVKRTVAAGVKAGRDTREVILIRILAAPVGRVWEAVTSGEHIGRWFAPISGSLRPEGTYQIEGNAGGEILSCDPPGGVTRAGSFSATWEFGDDVSWIRVAVEPGADDSTLLTLEHVAHVEEGRWLEFGPGAVGVGWELGLVGLVEYLANGSQREIRTEGERWAGSEDGRNFIGHSSEFWGEASAASGTPVDEALAAAARTTAFYTGADSAEATEGIGDLSEAPLLDAGWVEGSNRSAVDLSIVLPLRADELWPWITEPKLLRRWSPVVPDRPFVSLSPVTSRESPAADPVDATVVDLEPPHRLSHRWGGDLLTWTIAPDPENEQASSVLSLRQTLGDAEFSAMMLAGWHVCLATLSAHLEGKPVHRVVGDDALAHGWDGLRERYSIHLTKE
ncbi:SRPBCC domain-containing protein [Lysinibacter cavernae]|uniref:Uncharacterized protein YndB with AHSA1/START domain n=1 Tax=Lysinibacter cavernae TaxID=1640652 RepID=A0A7X5R120_9MICO|nr:SRPBCC domain-containing protein [Lysinibacter cavernae]NIH53730.1 uncharacterized protein YndB with AHSA1/START domain [Lysinibacter cavernae]